MKILLVEDNKTIGNNIKKYLELEHNDVMRAENGLYALEICKHHHFDVIILDLMLPGMDGTGDLFQPFAKKEFDLMVHGCNCFHSFGKG